MDIAQYLNDLRERQTRVRPAGTPSEVVYPLGEVSIPEHVAHWAAHRPDRPAVVFLDGTISYRELDDLVRRLAGWLESAGVRPGDRVGVHLPNCPQFIVAMLAVLRLGAVHVPVNPMFQSAELAHELNDSEAEVVVTLDSLLPVLQAVRGDSAVREVLVTTATEMAGGESAVPADIASDSAPVSLWADAVAGEPAGDRPADLDALAALNYTGGTTGLPKGCRHTQRTCCTPRPAVRGRSRRGPRRALPRCATSRSSGSRERTSGSSSR
ncbi:AMP-binding protein [Allosalinactinospora lopnorensis]|uniref:AMP-binding protein n=1 Tax=Allosalinactinospora lopnorensis TaxID=1352348 RepID=UPI000B109EC5|nr:AMP-binding protein [Allosalinactinospora lopnorensis]